MALSMTFAPAKTLSRAVTAFFLIGLAAFHLGCASNAAVTKRDGVVTNEDFLVTRKGDPTHSKSIFVFLDGTSNDKQDATNVWRLFQEVKLHGNLHTVGRYIPGVGTIKDPLEDDPLLPVWGDALGRGMQIRILAGYEFIAENYKPGDDIFIFGFSRGAHQARALAGMLSYIGVPRTMESDAELRAKKLERMLHLLKEKRDQDFWEKWEDRQPMQLPLLGNEIKADTDIAWDMQPVEVKLLGVWDTVPGSSFKHYNGCKEHIGFVKQYLWFLPLVSKGERYKSDSYPPIRRISHAVSSDENRSKFAPLYLCKAIAPQSTIVEEVWFPGAHADVGGGYGDNDLPNLSLSWVMDQLGKANYQFVSEPTVFMGNPKGLAHWSYGDFPGNMGSDCEGRRDSMDRQPVLGYVDDPSIGVRRRAGKVPILIKGVRNENDWTYPITCPGPGK